jgi:hypothetical protein
MREHKHDWFEPHQTWKEDLPALINKLGWKIFELPKAIKKQQEEKRKTEEHKVHIKERERPSTGKKFRLRGKEGRHD